MLLLLHATCVTYGSAWDQRLVAQAVRDVLRICQVLSKTIGTNSRILTMPLLKFKWKKWGRDETFLRKYYEIQRIYNNSSWILWRMLWVMIVTCMMYEDDAVRVWSLLTWSCFSLHLGHLEQANNNGNSAQHKHHRHIIHYPLPLHKTVQLSGAHYRLPSNSF